MKYRFMDDLTSDVLYEAYGKGLKEVFENAAEAMFSVICQLDKISEEKEIMIEAKGTDAKDLLYNWLQELILVVDTDEIFLKRFEIEEIDGTKLKAKCYGESAKPEKGETLVKAVTYYRFGLKKTDQGYVATVSLDI